MCFHGNATPVDVICRCPYTVWKFICLFQIIKQTVNNSLITKLYTKSWDISVLYLKINPHVVMRLMNSSSQFKPAFAVTNPGLHHFSISDPFSDPDVIETPPNSMQMKWNTTMLHLCKSRPYSTAWMCHTLWHSQIGTYCILITDTVRLVPVPSLCPVLWRIELTLHFHYFLHLISINMG